MLEVKVTITAAADLMAALNNLAAALDGNKLHTVQNQFGADSNHIDHVCTINMGGGRKTQSVTPAVNAAPTPTVPTSAPQYTLEMIATAGSALIDAGKMDQLMQLLGKFGVASLTELAPDNYGAMANELRALGAAI